jgi:AcrR family transcriptional regulator
MVPGEAPSRVSIRDRIPVVALQLFAERGYEATSMREIAEQLDVTKAALYYHFDSKEAIVQAVLAGVVAQLDELLVWARAQEPGHGTRLEALSRWSEVMQAHGLSMFRFMLTNSAIFRQARSNAPDMSEKMRELFALLDPPDASVEDQLRTRLALLSVNMGGIAGVDIDASESEILAATRRIAASLLSDA